MTVTCNFIYVEVVLKKHYFGTVYGELHPVLKTDMARIAEGYNLDVRYKRADGVTCLSDFCGDREADSYVRLSIHVQFITVLSLLS